jgi:probable HAF family extracellular repeat protein
MKISRLALMGLPLAALFSTAAPAETLYSVTDLGTLGGEYSSAYGINDAGQVVGFSGAATDYRAFLWAADSGMIDLNDLIDAASGWALDSASGINASGQIVGSGTIGGQTHAFLLTPISGGPEPATWAMMIVGFGMVGGAMRRRAMRLSSRAERSPRIFVHAHIGRKT